MRIGNAKVISFINLKGGVGKTTISGNIAAELAATKIGKEKKDFNSKVLFIDLDPQSNGSLLFLKNEEYKELENNKKTIFDMFDYEINRTEKEPAFDINTIIKEDAGNTNVDLIPSSLKLFDIQDKLPEFKRNYICAVDILFNCLSTSKKRYNYIIIDCPPNIGLITQNALALSKYYVVPVFLDEYSAWGLEKVMESVDN